MFAASTATASSRSAGDAAAGKATVVEAVAIAIGGLDLTAPNGDADCEQTTKPRKSR
jgi:hypothetical protein